MAEGLLRGGRRLYYHILARRTLPRAPAGRPPRGPHGRRPLPSPRRAGRGRARPPLREGGRRGAPRGPRGPPRPRPPDGDRLRRGPAPRDDRRGPVGGLPDAAPAA